ncbi:Type 1 glutamine amidotransferase-like domain-containing protein [Luteolibacter sp. Populi]|uniref:Type 1 glutamine amidotransferase-like domain-containing protein n=1 Tax=Luteolibacter sp. Populi TaxID=3230487 RepID=UPI0034674F7C
MGGGGFSMESNHLMDDFILSLSPRQPARVCFVPTASADSAAYLVKFYRAFSGRAIATDLTFFDPSSPARRPERSSELEAFVAEQDIIYVGGGNTANLLAIWRAHGLDKILREAWLRGAILCGVSAGMICWFRGGVTDSFGDLEALPDGLGLIDATACPHYDGEAQRRPTYQRLVGDGFPGGYAADDGAALHFRGTELVEALSSRDGAGVYRVEMRDGEVVERRLETRLLEGQKH